jgi:hypothetical protein
LRTSVFPRGERKQNKAYVRMEAPHASLDECRVSSAETAGVCIPLLTHTMTLLVPAQKSWPDDPVNTDPARSETSGHLTEVAGSEWMPPEARRATK